MAASRFGADAAGAFHGTLIENHLDEMQQVNCPISFHFGAEDPVVPIDVVNDIKSAYQNKADVEIVLHEGATHNFSMPYKEGYHADVAAASRQAVLETFNRIK